MNTRKPTRPYGFSLLEVLIALVVLSVGLLGLAALQAEGLRGSSNAQQRFQAVRLTSDIIDRMRANVEGGAADHYEVTKTDMVASGASNACADHGNSNAATDCNAEQMAKYDLSLWKQDLTQYLPSGAGGITKIADSRFLITVTWSDRGTGQRILSEVVL